MATSDNVLQITLGDEVGCARRELKRRRSVYPGRVAQGLMKQYEADREIAVMSRIFARLEALSENIVDR